MILILISVQIHSENNSVGETDCARALIEILLQCSLDISEMQGLGKSFAYREFSLIARVGA